MFIQYDFCYGMYSEGSIKAEVNWKGIMKIAIIVLLWSFVFGTTAGKIILPKSRSAAKKGKGFRSGKSKIDRKPIIRKRKIPTKIRPRDIAPQVKKKNPKPRLPIRRRPKKDSAYEMGCVPTPEGDTYEKKLAETSDEINPGSIYVYTVGDDPETAKGKKCFKVGKAEGKLSAEDRVRKQAGENGEKYTMLMQVRTTKPRLLESLVHAILHNERAYRGGAKNENDGRSEWFLANYNQIKEAIKKVSSDINNKSGKPKPVGKIDEAPVTVS